MRLRYWLFLGIVFCPAVNSALCAQTGQSESSAEERLARIQQRIQTGCCPSVWPGFIERNPYIRR